MMKPLRMFISYSHSDESYVNEFKKHLISLKRKQVIEEWHDRELTTGDKFDKEIERKLLDADLVAFMVSVDFLSSWYCYEVELKNTLSRIDNNNIRIIPIIIRNCKWKDTELANFLAATKDGTPINKYTDRDDAWTEVIDSIERAATKYNQTKGGQPISRDGHTSNNDRNIVSINSNFLTYLEDTEIVFSHRHKEEIFLKDIFVSPDLKNIKSEFDEIDITTRAMDLIGTTRVPEKIVILGAEQSGKTALSKIFFSELWNNKQYPLLCNGKQIKNIDANKLFSQLIKDQYSGLTDEMFLSDKNRIVLIIDDYDKIKINIRHQCSLLSILSTIAGRIIIISGTSIRYDESKYVELSDFAQYEILPLGNLRRGELIEKWNCIGREETIDVKDLHDQNDRITTHLNSIIRRNILPPKPIYILTIIQLLDTSKPSDYSLTSYGHCYQSLIQSNLERVNIKPRDFDLYINYLTEIAYYIYNTKTYGINEAQLTDFKERYSEQYLVQSNENVVGSLLASGILRSQNDITGFSYRYIFYFYVAKYLADHLDIDNCKIAIEHLCKNINTEKNANILIFLVHHSKDKQIIDEILLHASVVFDGTTEARLDKHDTKYLLDYIATIPRLVIEQRDIDDERRSRLKEKDLIEEATNEDADNDIEETHDAFLSDINRSARVVEIIGQILRNRYGSLTKTQLRELTLSAYSSGLKFLSFFLTATREGQDYILEFIKKIFKENTKLSDDEIASEARSIFLMFCYGTSYSVIKKIANSIGSDKLMPIFDEIVLSGTKSPAMKLIHIAIQMEFTKKIPKRELSELYLELNGNPIAQRLLQEIVIQHLYLNHVDFQDRQWISSKIHLPIKSQRLIQSKSEHKS